LTRPGRTILQRNGTAARWASVNPVLGVGEVGWETNTKKIKIGDGITPWNSLAYFYSAGTAAWGSIGGTLSSQTDLQTALNAKSDTGHGHAILDVSGLQTALDAKAPLSHSHIIADVTGLQTALDNKQAAGSYANLTHGHAIADVTNLQTTLDGKQPLATVLTNTTAAFTTVQETKLAGIATGATANSSDATLLNRANHTGSQDISTVTGLQTALDGKQAALVSATNIKTINGASVLGSGDLVVSGSAAWGSVTGTLSSQTDLQTALNAKAASAHTHTTADVTDLDRLLYSVGREYVGRFAVYAVGDNGTSFSVLGSTGVSVTGNATAYAIATTNKFTRNKWIEAAVTTPATTAIGGYRINSTTNSGVFLLRDAMYFKTRAAPMRGCTTASHRFFTGLRAVSTAPTDVEPSSQVNIIGIGYDSADTQVQIMHNDGSGSATKVPLGVNFPKPNANDTFGYVLELLTLTDGASSVIYRVTALNNGAVATGTLSSDLVNTSSVIGGYCSAGGTSTAIGYGFGFFEVFTR